MASGAPPIARTRAGRAATSVDCLARQIQQERCGTGHRNSDHQGEQTDQLPRPCTKRRSWARFRQLHQMRRHSLYLDGAPDRISRRSDIPNDGSSSVHPARVVEALEKPKRRGLQAHRLAAGGAALGAVLPWRRSRMHGARYFRVSTPVCVLYCAASPQVNVEPLCESAKKSKSPN